MLTFHNVFTTTVSLKLDHSISKESFCLNEWSPETETLYVSKFELLNFKLTVQIYYFTLEEPDSLVTT